MNQFLHFVAAITFFCMSAKHNVSGPSTFYIALKTLEKLTHFMLTHVLISVMILRIALVDRNPFWFLYNQHVWTHTAG